MCTKLDTFQLFKEFLTVNINHFDLEKFKQFYHQQNISHQLKSVITEDEIWNIFMRVKKNAENYEKMNLNQRYEYLVEVITDALD